MHSPVASGPHRVLRLQIWTPAVGGVINLAVRVFDNSRSKLWVAILATFVFAFLLAAVVAGQPPEPVFSGQDRMEVVSPAGVATFGGELRGPR